MSLDANTWIKLIKRAALEAVDARKPFGMCLGEVIEESPLKIRIDQKITLSSEQLLLTDSVRRHRVYMTNGEYASGEYTVHRELKRGERVVMLRCDGGQRFIVLDRAEAT